VTMPRAQTTAAASGKAAEAYSVAATIPPIITHSPWAKLIASVALKTRLKPSAASA